jgi:hypothetical protein
VDGGAVRPLFPLVADAVVLVLLDSGTTDYYCWPGFIERPVAACLTSSCVQASVGHS